MRITDLCREAYAISASKGFHDEPSSMDRRLLLTVGELIEAHEELRAGHYIDEIYYKPDDHGFLKPEGFPIEVADAVIRICDMMEASGLGQTLEDSIRIKLDYNKNRPYKHGKVF